VTYGELRPLISLIDAPQAGAITHEQLQITRGFLLRATFGTKLAAAAALSVFAVTAIAAGAASAGTTVTAGASDRLESGKSLKADQYVASRDGSHKLYQQKDGNLVLRKGTEAVWAAKTSGAGVFTTMQQDGNLVVRDRGGEPLWSTGTASPGAILGVQNDGNIVILSKTGKVVWALN
jgi:hypothetical protein